MRGLVAARVSSDLHKLCPIFKTLGIGGLTRQSPYIENSRNFKSRRTKVAQNCLKIPNMPKFFNLVPKIFLIFLSLEVYGSNPANELIPFVFISFYAN